MLFFALNYLPCAFDSTEIIIKTTLIYKRLRPLFYCLQDVGMSREDRSPERLPRTAMKLGEDQVVEQKPTAYRM